MTTIKFFAPVMSALQRQQKILTRRLFAMGLALVGAGLLAMPAAGQALPEGHTISFEVEGTWTSEGIVDAHYLTGPVRGMSSLGPFTGRYIERWGHERRLGSATLDYAHGSLTVDYLYRLEGKITAVPSFWMGSYVVRSGTGWFEGATGDGEIIVIGGTPETGPTGPFLLSGTLSR